MMTKDEAMKLALEALECAIPHKKRIGDDDYLEGAWTLHNKAITALREALASEAIEQPAQQEFVCSTGLCHYKAQQQEPVAWATRMGEYAHIHWGAKRPEYPMVYEVPLYTSPPAQRKPLTDGEINKAAEDEDNETAFLVGFYAGARFAEAAHGIKENT